MAQGTFRRVIHLAVEGMACPIPLEVVAQIHDLSFDVVCSAGPDGAVAVDEVDFGIVKAYASSPSFAFTCG